MRCVTGEIPGADIHGRVLPHEHLILDLRTEKDHEGYIFQSADVIDELSALREESLLGLVVDQTCRGMGRDVATLHDISVSSGVPIVAATGWYYQRFHPEGEPPHDLDEAIGILMGEIEEGIDGAGLERPVRAGVIGEIGTHAEEPTDAERVCFEASARVSVATKTPIATHAHLGTGTYAQMRVLAESSADMTHVVFGHQDLCRNTQQHIDIAKEGAYIGFDTVGKTSYQPDEVRVELICDLLEAGYGQHILLSNDISRHAYLAVENGQGYGHTFNRFLARLNSAGVSEEDIELMTRANPLRWLEWE